MIHLFFKNIFAATSWVSDMEYIFLFLLILLGLILGIPFLVKFVSIIINKLMKTNTTIETTRWFRRITRPYRIGRLTRPPIIRRLTRKENGSKTTN